MSTYRSHAPLTTSSAAVHVVRNPVTSKSHKGRHRAPSKSRVRAVLVGTVTAGALALGGAGTASADPLGAIAQCESGGNIHAENSHSTASGKYQFLDSTWRSLGGTGRAKHASESEQDRMARKLMNVSGTSPWNASKSCWKGKASEKSASKKADKPSKKKAVPQATQPKRKAAAPLKAKGEHVVQRSSGTYVIKPGDTFNKLAQKKHKTPKALLALNPSISNPNRIIAGHTLNV